MSPSGARRRHAAIAVAAALSALGLAAVGLAGPGWLRPAQAAPVPAAQAGCPPPVDPQPIAATTNSFARLDGIPGDATASQVVGQIALTSVRSALTGVGSGLCGAGGRLAVDPIIVEKRIDRASVPLLAHAAQGLHIPTARISVWSTTTPPRQIFSYDLTDVQVASVRQLQRGTSLTEEVALTFTRVTWTFAVQNPDGSAGPSIVSCFDIVRAAAC